MPNKHFQNSKLTLMNFQLFLKELLIYLIFLLLILLFLAVGIFLVINLFANEPIIFSSPAIDDVYDIVNI